MANPILRGFRNMARFSGRDTRGQFWPYVAAVVLLVSVGWGVFVAAQMAVIFDDVSAFAAAHPEAATVQSSPGQYSVQIDPRHPAAPAPDFSAMFVAMWVMGLSTVALLAAAVSRRLHDRNMPAFWGLLPLPFLTAGLVLFPMMITPLMEGGSEPDLSLFGLLFVNNLVYMVALVTLVILLAGGGTDGPNRYGAASQP